MRFMPELPLEMPDAGALAEGGNLTAWMTRAGWGNAFLKVGTISVILQFEPAGFKDLICTLQPCQRAGPASCRFSEEKLSHPRKSRQSESVHSQAVSRSLLSLWPLVQTLIYTRYPKNASRPNNAFMITDIPESKLGNQYLARWKRASDMCTMQNLSSKIVHRKRNQIIATKSYATLGDPTAWTRSGETQQFKVAYAEIMRFAGVMKTLAFSHAVQLYLQFIVDRKQLTFELSSAPCIRQSPIGTLEMVAVYSSYEVAASIRSDFYSRETTRPVFGKLGCPLTSISGNQATIEKSTMPFGIDTGQSNKNVRDPK
ncbi:uncharacterized protein BDR25DRAFT_359664 [Lindgomyces ingoldianus]|uniref:Uncharacterized protein n=1 Tax=Lindgomyces ingoldianus TaxID=673940 RepID=A0ACB6QH29_9PLEO|nr:uncharacterized protein BDR25DRAFT_359664 [Lindgomyces ingoldianus]KAF2466294.1 hypothetical protein BDR25DRAFT_359664 [Lindgomyces ingoldianus]